MRKMIGRLFLLMGIWTAGVSSAANDAFVVPAVTNVATFLVQVTNSTSFALLPTNLFFQTDTRFYTNKLDIARETSTTNVAALIAEAASLTNTTTLQLAPNAAVAGGEIVLATNAVAQKAGKLPARPKGAAPVANVPAGPKGAAPVANVPDGPKGAAPVADVPAGAKEVASVTNAPVVAGMTAGAVTNIVQATLTNTVKQAAMDAVVEAVNAVNAAADKVMATEKRRRITTRTFKLSHISATEVAERFNAMWSGDFGIGWKVTQIAQAFPESNAVMVTAPGVIIEACEQAIEAIDVEPRQVYIEARFVELENSAIHKLGIDWSMLDGMGGTASFGAGIDKRNVGNAVTDFSRSVTTGNETIQYGLAGSTSSKSATSTTTRNADGTTSWTDTSTSSSTDSGRDGGVSYFTGTLSFTDMSLVLSALDTSSDAKIFSNPKIIVANGKKATVDMTEKYPNVQIAAKRTLNGNSESLDLDMKMAAIPGKDTLMFANEAFFSWGISLEVTPRVSSNNLISVSIVPTISEKAGDVTVESETAPGSKYPIINVQRLVTDFALEAGTTAVIGGLSKTTEEQVDTGIPWLREIPYIGDKLFGRKVRQKVQKEILVFVTVGLADPRTIKTDAGLPKNAVLGRMYTEGQKFEPGDRTGNAIEGLASLDKRPLEEQARDPLATNKVEKTTFQLPFGSLGTKEESK